MVPGWGWESHCCTSDSMGGGWPVFYHKLVRRPWVRHPRWSNIGISWWRKYNEMGKNCFKFFPGRVCYLGPHLEKLMEKNWKLSILRENKLSNVGRKVSGCVRQNSRLWAAILYSMCERWRPIIEGSDFTLHRNGSRVSIKMNRERAQLNGVLFGM